MSALLLDAKWIKDALAYGPFDGDRDVDVRTLRDRIVKARKAGTCHWCAGEIVPGATTRSLTEVCEGEGIGTFRFCFDCCDAMAKSWGADNGKLIDERYALGMKRRATKKARQ